MSLNAPEEASGDKGKWSLEGDAEIWRTFSAPNSDAQFCQAWLALLCRQLPGISAGVVLLESAEESTFLPIAVWPEVDRDLSFLGKTAERALLEARGVVHRPDDSADRHIHVAYPVEVSNKMVGAVVLEGEPSSDADVHALLRQLHWGIAWLHDLLNRRELILNEGKSERIGSVMEVFATALRRGELQKTLFDICNHIARQMQCARVSIGLAKDGLVRVAALSNAAWFEKNTGIIKLYRAAMEDVLDRSETVVYRVGDDAVAGSNNGMDSPYASLVQESAAQSILAIPLLVGAECVAILVLEKDTGDGFDEAEHAWVETLGGLLPAVIELKEKAERSYLARIKEDWRSLLERLFGPRYLVWKFSATLIVATVALLLLFHIDYRVTAKTAVEGKVQISAVAPFDGFIAASYARAGDMVVKNQVLCTLDDRDLKLEKQKWESEREQYLRKWREAVSKHSMTEVRILSAQIHQAEAQYDLVGDRLDHIQIKAPFDGVVISGDLSQLIGSPVETGKKLFEIAPLRSYRVVLQVDESEMRHIKIAQSGDLMISGIVGDPVPFHISKITPMATAKDGKNFFRVEASLDQQRENLRPGMEGIGKIEVGERQLWWVLTHTFIDWLRISMWSWMP